MTWKPSASRYGSRPACERYRVTTWDPGARLVFTWWGTSSPSSTDLRARSPAPSITDGFEVFVHDVMAAMTTAPLSIDAVTPSTATDTCLCPLPASPLLPKAPG